MSKNENPAIREATGAFCRSILDAILPAIRTVARFHGYAITVHGSLKRDIDLVAIAWTDQAYPADDLAHAVRGAVAGILGNCLIQGKEDGSIFAKKPHGRLACIMIHPGFAGEIDLSIIPPRVEGTE